MAPRLRRMGTSFLAIGLVSAALATLLSAESSSYVPSVLSEQAAATEHSPALLGRRAAAQAAFPAMLGLYAESAQATGKFDGFKRIPTQFIAALGDPAANSGTGAQTWGLWRKDPGPRGVELKDYDRLKAAGGVAPARWQFDTADWWLEEHGLIMEKPDTPMPPGRYVVTGAREVTTILTVDGAGGWQLADGAKLYDVTHLPCRSARYTGPTCSPEQAKQSDFPVTPGGPMPGVSGCNKLDYAVLFVIGIEA